MRIGFGQSALGLWAAAAVSAGAPVHDRDGELPLLRLCFLVQLVCGLLFLANRFVPLVLTLLAPVLVNILLYHALRDPPGLPIGAVAVLLWLVLFFSMRRSPSGILRPTPL